MNFASPENARAAVNKLQGHPSPSSPGLLISAILKSDTAFESAGVQQFAGNLQTDAVLQSAVPLQQLAKDLQHHSLEVSQPAMHLEEPNAISPGVSNSQQQPSKYPQSLQILGPVRQPPAPFQQPQGVPQPTMPTQHSIVSHAAGANQLLGVSQSSTGHTGLNPNSLPYIPKQTAQPIAADGWLSTRSRRWQQAPFKDWQRLGGPRQGLLPIRSKALTSMHTLRLQHRLQQLCRLATRQLVYQPPILLPVTGQL